MSRVRKQRGGEASANTSKISWRKFQEGQNLNDIVALTYQLAPVQSSQFPRSSHASCVLGTRIYIFGGASRQGYMNQLLMLETNAVNGRDCSWQEIEASGDIPEPRAYCEMTAIGDEIYLFGGMVDRTQTGDGSGTGLRNDMFILHTKQDSHIWERVL